MPSRFAPSTPPRVRVSDCLCPGTPHEGGDFVTLYSALPIEAGTAATRALARMGAGSDPEVVILKAILPHVVSDWTFLDHESGEPLDITPESVTEALPWTHGGYEVAKEAADRYLGSVVTPFLSLASKPKKRKSSRTTPTVSTSARTPSSSETPESSE